MAAHLRNNPRLDRRWASKILRRSVFRHYQAVQLKYSETLVRPFCSRKLAENLGSRVARAYVFSLIPFPCVVVILYTDV
jgi:hypothetical protein